MYKVVEGYENYRVSKNGTVTNNKGLKLSQFWRGCKKRDGQYLCVTLYNKGKKKNHAVHRLVAIAYIPNPENKEEVDHIDMNRENNNCSNLRWLTRQENQSNTRRSKRFKNKVKEKQNEKEKK
jgi:hypothetical protein